MAGEEILRKLAIIATVLISGALLCGSVSADSTAKELSTGSTWDVPAKGTLDSYKIEEQLMAARATFQWTPAQLKQFQGSDFFPALAFKTDGLDQLRAKVMFTDLPGAKFIRDDAAYGAGERIKVVTLDTARVAADTPYELYTAWLRTKDGDPKVTLQSLQGYAQPNGLLNDLPRTNNVLASFSWNQATLVNKKYRDMHQTADFGYPFQQYVEGERQTMTKMQSHSTIRTKDELERYKTEAAKRVQALSDDETVRFAITFLDPYSIGEVISGSGVTISQWYAVGYPLGSSGKPDKSHPYTLSWFESPGMDMRHLLNIRKRSALRRRLDYRNRRNRHRTGAQKS
jgi:hypothetical protein